MTVNNDSHMRSVKDYWNCNPLYSIEFRTQQHDKEYFDKIDKLRWGAIELFSKGKFYEIDFPAGAKVLDAGCGIGVFTRYYARRGLDVTAVDLSKKSLEIAQKSCEIYGLEARFLESSVECLPFEDSSFDYVVSNGVIHHTENTEKAVAEIFRVMKPGGVASIAIYYRNMWLQPMIWPLTRFLVRLLLRNTDGRGHFFLAKTPEDFVRVYDGDNTPIAKVYTQAESRQLFQAFKQVEVATHYFPMRFFPKMFHLKPIHYICDRIFGCLIYFKLEKPRG